MEIDLLLFACVFGRAIVKIPGKLLKKANKSRKLDQWKILPRIQICHD